jgi:hypothetical protein
MGLVIERPEGYLQVYEEHIDIFTVSMVKFQSHCPAGSRRFAVIGSVSDTPTSILIGQIVLCHSNMEAVHTPRPLMIVRRVPPERTFFDGMTPITSRASDNLYRSFHNAWPMYITSLMQWWTSFVEHRSTMGQYWSNIDQ